jgi:hypothetical protein
VNSIARHAPGKWHKKFSVGWAMMRSGWIKIFNSIGAIGLLVLAGALLTTTTTPENSWPDLSTTGSALAYPVSDPLPRSISVLQRTASKVLR